VKASHPPASDIGANIQAMYQELILDHYRKPRNKGELENADRVVPMHNPLCGDEIFLHVKFDGDRVSDLKFTGRGCSISQAAASMMTESVKGKTAAEADTLWQRYHAMILGDQDAARLPDRSFVALATQKSSVATGHENFSGPAERLLLATHAGSATPRRERVLRLAAMLDYCIARAAEPATRQASRARTQRALRSPPRA
jgi:nitrogen fixation NifU-like protein